MFLTLPFLQTDLQQFLGVPNSANSTFKRCVILGTGILCVLIFTNQRMHVTHTILWTHSQYKVAVTLSPLQGQNLQFSLTRVLYRVNSLVSCLDERTLAECKENKRQLFRM